MARPAQNPEAVHDLADHLQALRESAPGITPSFKKIERTLLRDYDYDASAETIRKAHVGMVDPASCSAELLMGLMRFYQAEPADLGDHAERRLRVVLAMADHGEPPNPHSGGGSGNRGGDLPGRESGCTATVVPLRRAG